VVGFKTDEFPAFYSRTSGLQVSVRLDAPPAIADFALTHWGMISRSAVLVANPVPEMDSIPRAEIEPIIERASREARDKKVHGQALSPFLLQRVNELSSKRSMRANLALLLNNARLAAEIAIALASLRNKRS
jgi:pseudouridine-5'-phosphate glycosidase